jgi:single-stranded-DNA-specific exonuclease
MTPGRSRWNVLPPPDLESVRVLADSLRLPRTLAAMLVQRGHGTPDDARLFLRPSLDGLSDPFLMRDMDRAAGLVAQAVRAGQTILVHGDYDVDGQCAAALLTRFLEHAGAKVIPFVPHRVRDGYDFGPAGLAKARECGASLVLTCDCGVTAVETVASAKEAGLTVVVTDHHLPGDLPPADAVVNPRRPDCESTGKELCGAGVAFKLVQALCAELGLAENTGLHFLDLVAMATVADIVPLVGENRTLVRFGLKMLQQSRWAGVRALLQVTRLAGKQVRAGQVGFVLGPRLNAVGRIGDAMDGLRLLLTDNEAEAHDLARQLDTANAKRQEMDERILDEAVEAITTTVDFDESYGLVLGRDEWHAGVIGIVASRVVERYNRPTILVALDGDEGKGSGRSIPGFDLHSALSRCAEHLERWGGHKAAAGVTLKRSNLDRFRTAFNDAAREDLTPDDLIPTQRIDIVGNVQSFDDDLERLMRHLEPCGAGNPAPVLGVERAFVRRPETVGSNHLKFTLDDGTGRLPAIGFGWADRVDRDWIEEPVDVALRLDRHEWRGANTLQARVVNIKPAGG